VVGIFLSFGSMESNELVSDEFGSKLDASKVRFENQFQIL